MLRLAKGMMKCYKIKTITQIKGHTRKQQVRGFEPIPGSILDKYSVILTTKIIR